MSSFDYDQSALVSLIYVLLRKSLSENQAAWDIKSQNINFLKIINYQRHANCNHQLNTSKFLNTLINLQHYFDEILIWDMRHLMCDEKQLYNLLHVIPSQETRLTVCTNFQGQCILLEC